MNYDLESLTNIGNKRPRTSGAFVYVPSDHYQSLCCFDILNNQVHYLSPIQHRNLVTLLGYCQENNLQFLVYEYVPNGSVSSHLYGNSLPSHRFRFVSS